MVSLSNMARLTAIQSRLCHPNPKKFALGAELDSILEVWKKALAACGITIDDRSAGESALIQGDRVFFGELIKNILENCRMRMKDGGTISIGTALTRGQTDTLSFIIEDNGRNLDAEELAKLDLDSLGTRAYRKGGEALRLSLCRYLSECLDWNFAISNIEGGGARFTLDITLSGGK